MKFTQEQRLLFRELIKDVATITDPGQISTKTAVFVPKEIIKRMEQTYFRLGRTGFYENLKELLDENTEK